MSRMKTFGKYALMVIGIYFFTSILIFIGFNLNYKNITIKGDMPKEISIAKAESTSNTGRIYGYISNYKENNINGKYIKIEILNSDEEISEIQYLKIDDVKYNDKKMFKAFFKTENAKFYKISIVDNEK
ncbi:MAG: hypothetical protein HFJ17_06210 [Clostridia bacterium]|nr:hypothetical protein [Clostridia bacterium]